MLETIMIAVASILLLLQLFFYLVPATAIFAKKQKKTLEVDKSAGVSVIIACHNELQNLQTNLQFVLNQDFLLFEVIVVDDNSDDASMEYLLNLSDKHLRVLRSNGKGKKAALSYAIEQAKYQKLLFTDADCLPASPQWISEMTSHLNKNTHLVLGYGELSGKGFVGKFSTYDAMLIAIQYLGFAKCGKIYMAVGRNLAYNKQLWLQLGGFSEHAEIPSGDDDLFVRQVKKTSGVEICILPQAKTISPAKYSLSAFLHQKNRHISTAKKYNLAEKFLSGGEIITRFCFFASLAVLFVINWQLALGIMLVRLALVMSVVIIYKQKIKTDVNAIFLLIFDIFAPIFYFILLIYKLLNKSVKW